MRGAGSGRSSAARASARPAAGSSMSWPPRSAPVDGPSDDRGLRCLGAPRRLPAESTHKGLAVVFALERRECRRADRAADRRALDPEDADRRLLRQPHPAGRTGGGPAADRRGVLGADRQPQGRRTAQAPPPTSEDDRRGVEGLRRPRPPTGSKRSATSTDAPEIATRSSTRRRSSRPTPRSPRSSARSTTSSSETRRRDAAIAGTLGSGRVERSLW